MIIIIKFLFKGQSGFIKISSITHHLAVYFVLRIPKIRNIFFRGIKHWDITSLNGFIQTIIKLGTQI